MPYKHIATQLKKTELACRLHYHQLSFGSKSRRHPSMSPYDRQSAPPSEKFRRETPTPQRQLPSFSPPSSPPDNIEYSSSDPSKTPQIQKTLLPKPVTNIHRRDSTPLRLVTEMDRLHETRQFVDMAKLDRIYEEHRLHFWSTIARSYGCNLSPATLEEAWCRAHAMSGSRYPPTPRGSPQASAAPSSAITSAAPSSVFTSAAPYSGFSALTDPSRSFTPINTEGPIPKPTVNRNNSLSVSSLLTEDKEVRLSPCREKKPDEMEMS